MEVARAPAGAVRAPVDRGQAVAERERAVMQAAGAGREQAPAVEREPTAERELTARLVTALPATRAVEALVARAVVPAAATLGGVVIQPLAQSLASPTRINAAVLARRRTNRIFERSGLAKGLSRCPNTNPPFKLGR